MKIEKNKVVSLSYCLEVEGKVADRADSSKPLEYIHGTHMLLAKFESEVEGKKEGDTFEFTLSPDEGYGTVNPDYRFPLPIQSFAGPDGNIRRDLLIPGSIIPLMDTAGAVHQAKIISVGEDEVMMDFNHPMAGKTLHFTGKVEKIRDASEKELLEGLHGEFAPKEECHCHKGGGGGCCHHHEDGAEEGCCHHHEDGAEKGCCHHHDGEGCCKK